MAAFCCSPREPGSSEESVWHPFARLSSDTSHRAKGRRPQKERSLRKGPFSLGPQCARFQHVQRSEQLPSPAKE